jgi:hypothetical protein
MPGSGAASLDTTKEAAEARRRCGADIAALATQYGHYGYRRITAMLHAAGWEVERQTGREDLWLWAEAPTN